MKKLLADSFVLGKQLATGQAAREVYLLFAVAKLGAFVCGVAVGVWLL